MQIAPTISLDSLLLVRGGDVPLTPVQIFGSALYGWWDAQNNALITLDGSNKVSNIAPSGGTSGLALLQPTAGKRPTLANNINGKQCLNFVKASSQDVSTNFGAVVLPQPFTTVFVAKYPAQAVGGSSFILADQNTAVTLSYTDAPGIRTFSNGGVNISDGGLVNDTPFWCAVHLAGTSSYIRNNGGAKVGVGTNAGTGSFATLCLASQQVSNWADADIGEVMLISGDITDFQISQLATYMLRWGL